MRMMMMRCAPERSVVMLAAVAVLLSCGPADAWYKQATGPSYYSVGRASGLLSGMRRSPYVRRSDAESTLDAGDATGNSVAPELGARHTPVLKNMVNNDRVNNNPQLTFLKSVHLVPRAFCEAGLFGARSFCARRATRAE